MKPKKGKLLVIYGPMFSGKTTWLVDWLRQNKQMVVFKPEIDTRYTSRPVLHTHEGIEAPAIKVNVANPKEILTKLSLLPNRRAVNTVIIDEVNLYNKKLLPVVKNLLHQGLKVITAGILLDTEKGDFGQTSALAGMADETVALYARCDYKGCQELAPYTYAKKIKKTQVLVGADDVYGAACEKHYDLLHVSGKSESVAVSMRRDELEQLVSWGVYPAYAQWLRGVKLPYVRRGVDKAPGDRSLGLEIGGDEVDLDKQKLVAEIRSRLSQYEWKLNMIEEDVGGNPHLNNGYLSETEDIFQAECWFMIRKFEQMTKYLGKGIKMLCVPPEQEFCYAVGHVLTGRMSLQQFFDYEAKFYELAWSKQPLPQLMIRIERPAESQSISTRLITRSNFSGAENYSQVVQFVFDSWLEGIAKEVKVLRIRSDEVTRAAGRRKIVEFVMNEIKLQGGVTK